MSRPLTPRQQAFCLAYLRTLNASAAALEAGYSPRTAKQAGAENLSKPYLRVHLEELKAGRFSKAAMAAQEVLEELTLLARTDIADFLMVEKNGAVRVKAFSDMPAGASRCIRKIRQKTVRKMDPADPKGAPLEECTIEIELWSKEEALDRLARYHGLLAGPGEEEEGQAIINITYVEAKPPERLARPSRDNLRPGEG